MNTIIESAYPVLDKSEINQKPDRFEKASLCCSVSIPTVVCGVANVLGSVGLFACAATGNVIMSARVSLNSLSGCLRS